MDGFTGILRVRDRVRIWELELERRRSQAEDKQDTSDGQQHSLPVFQEARLMYHHPESKVKSEYSMDLETAMIRLEEEKSRCENFSQINTMLRNQLEEATQANRLLTEDVQRLTQEWQKTREELDIKETEWRDEEQSFNDYFTKEHHQLLALWRQLLQFRQDFSQMKFLTEKDLSALRAHFGQTSRNMTDACLSVLNFTSVSGEGNETSSWQMHKKLQEMLNEKLKYDVENLGSQERIQELSEQNERQKSLLMEKEKIIASLNKSMEAMLVKDIGPGCGDLREDFDTVRNALWDIAKAVVEDVDQTYSDSLLEQHFLTNALTSVRNALAAKSSSNLESRYILDLTTSIVSVVQSLLTKRRQQIEDLHRNLATSEEQHRTQVKLLDEAEEERQHQKRLIMQLNSQLQVLQEEVQDSLENKEKIKSIITASGSERIWLEKTRRTLNDQIDALNSENDRLHTILRDYQHKVEKLEEEREDLISQDHYYKLEKERSEKYIGALENQLSVLKEEIIGEKEVLSRTKLESEFLQHEKSNLENRLIQAVRKTTDLELELEEARTTENSLRDTILQLQNLNESFGQDKIELNKYITEVEDSKENLAKEKNDLEKECRHSKEELKRLLQRLNEAEANQATLGESVERAKAMKDKLEDEMDQMVKERMELQTQLTGANRQKQSLTEKFHAAQETIKECHDKFERIRKEKEKLTQDHAQLLQQMDASDKEQMQQGEIITALQEEKEELQRAIYSLNQSKSLLEESKKHLEEELEVHRTKQQLLQGQLLDLKKLKNLDEEMFARTKSSLTERLQQLEHEYQVALQQEKHQRKVDIEILNKEKESQRARFEVSYEEITSKMQNEREELINSHQEEINSLKQELENIQRTTEEKQIQNQLERKQAEEIANQEKGSLLKQLQQTQEEVKQTQQQLLEARNIAEEETEKKKTAIKSNQQQLKKVKEDLENTITQKEMELKEISIQLDVVLKERDSALQDITRMKAVLQKTEESKDHVKEELLHSKARIRELEVEKDNAQKQGSDCQRMIKKEKTEKEQLQKNNSELISRTKQLEMEKAELDCRLKDAQNQLKFLEDSKSRVLKECNELRNTLRDVEKSRLQARQNVQSLSRQVGKLEVELKGSKEISQDLKAQQQVLESREDCMQKEVSSLKQNLMKAEASKEALSREVANYQRKLSDLEYQMKLQVEDHSVTLKEYWATEQEAEKQRAELQKTLTSLSEEAQNLQVQLSVAEEKVNAMEKQLNNAENSKKDMIKKLASIYEALYYYLGIKMDESIGANPLCLPSAGLIHQSSLVKKFANFTVSKAWTKSSSPRNKSSLWSTAEMDVYLVRSALKDLVNKLHSTEKDRDNWKFNAHRYQHQLDELKEEHSNVTSRLELLHKSLEEIQNEKQGVHQQLSTTKSTLLHQEETILRLEKERKNLSEKITVLEQELLSTQKDKQLFQEKLARMKQMEVEHQKEKRSFLKAFDKAGYRATFYEKTLQSLQGEIQKLKLSLKDRETEKQVVTLNHSLTETVSSSQTLQQQLQQLKQELFSTEQEKTSLQQRMEDLRYYMEDTKQQNKYTEEQLQQSKKELNDTILRCEELEEQLRRCNQVLEQRQQSEQETHYKIQSLQREKAEILQELDKLRKTVMRMEHQREELEHVCHKSHSLHQHFEEKIERERLRTEEFASQSAQEQKALNRSLNYLEKENLDLQKKVQTLQTHLAQLEQRHSQRLIELGVQQKQEENLEMENFKIAQKKAEALLESRERSHQQKVLSLEHEITTLRQQLLHQQQRWEQFRLHSSQAGNEIRSLRSVLDSSLRNVSGDPRQLDLEARKLDNTIERHLIASPSITLTTPSKFSRASSPPQRLRTSTPTRSKARKRLEVS
ncbi:uncharacterized protein LOC143233272 isoform X5 [Tachypleus tridentatus]|uniref:uncharacterized protein LOC143233272 isoform X5 n=1 Tax=Tachypleus tridentatus TaxID=6853 RepID=UPI003FD6A3D4